MKNSDFEDLGTKLHLAIQNLVKKHRPFLQLFQGEVVFCHEEYFHVDGLHYHFGHVVTINK